MSPSASPSASGAPWTPADATPDGGYNAVHWYRADDCYEDAARTTVAADDGDPVGSWTDKASADHASQGTSANRPTLQTAELNGESVLRFDGSNDYLQGAYTNGGVLDQPFTILVVSKLDASAVNDNVDHKMIDGDDSSDRAMIGKDGATTPDDWEFETGTSITGGAADSNWNIWTLVGNGASSRLWQNGISEAAGNSGAEEPTGITIGARYSAEDYWDGDIAEIVIFEANLSNADKNTLGGYASDRYNIAYTDIV